MIPAVVYGAGQESQAIAVDPKQMNRILHSEAGHNSIFDLSLDGQSAKVMIVDWQYEPIKGALLHVDLKRIAMDKVLRVSVPIVLKGEAPGVKVQGGILGTATARSGNRVPAGGHSGPHRCRREPAACLAQVIRVSDLPHGGSIKFITDENQPVAHVVAVKEVVEAAPAEAAAEGAAVPAEPEVIKKGKQESRRRSCRGRRESREGRKKPEKSEKKK